MNVNHVLHVREGNAIKTLQDFLALWWGQLELDAMLAPVETDDPGVTASQVICQPADLIKVNPFAPVMLSNTAAMVQEFINENPTSHLAVILRPCELRAMVELRKRHRVLYQSVSSGNDQESLVVISVDCPGTFSRAEYEQHVAAHQEDTDMIHVNLSYGSQDSYIPYDVRENCQLCDSPAPLGADITIGTIGIEPQGEILVTARNEEIDSSLRLGNVTDGIATEHQVVSREVMVGKLADKRAEKRSALMKSQIFQTEDMTTLLALFARCTLCADCLAACPLYDGELAGMLGVGQGSQSGHSPFAELVRVSRWLASCSGCGMCRESCEQGIPINQMITVLSHGIQGELHYRPGDLSQRLPWMIERVE